MDKEKFLFELVTGDGLEYVFCVAYADDHAIQLAMEKTKEEGELYEFEYESICLRMPVSIEVEVGVYEYINNRDISVPV